MAFLSSAPYVILPSFNQETNYEDNNVHRNILVLFHGKFYTWNTIFKSYEGAWCIGSSNNFLIFLDNKGCLFLLNPSSNTFIHVPPFTRSFIKHANVPSYSYYVQSLRKTFVSKAVLMSSPSPSQYTLAIMYDSPCRIAFCNNHNASWVELSDAKRLYSDIVFDNNILYALDEDGSIEGWDFLHQKFPKKVLEINYPTMILDKEEEVKFSTDKFSTKLYLVMFKRDFLLIERFIGNFVNANGEVVYEGSCLSDQVEICPYRTKHFNVYKLNLVKRKWEKMNSLEGQVVFVGANESKLVDSSKCDNKENLIYFSDDRWEEMNLDYSYGGHDWGVFNLQDSSIRLLTPDVNKMDPPPIWMVPYSN
ncbi:putative F-box protein At5g55150 [Vicia villosa]|uniref:putative F-box protein At5g55150 n=1 Tax=Vicia villosa TaxID=3911 RepID=UPI00273AE129|nr:putative F-box protein At5g55150 [Vicia villosa]